MYTLLIKDSGFKMVWLLPFLLFLILNEANPKHPSFINSGHRLNIRKADVQEEFRNEYKGKKENLDVGLMAGLDEMMQDKHSHVYSRFEQTENIEEESKRYPSYDLYLPLVEEKKSSFLPTRIEEDSKTDAILYESELRKNLAWELIPKGENIVVVVSGNGDKDEVKEFNVRSSTISSTETIASLSTEEKSNYGAGSVKSSRGKRMKKPTTKTIAKGFTQLQRIHRLSLIGNGLVRDKNSKKETIPMVQEQSTTFPYQIPVQYVRGADNEPRPTQLKKLHNIWDYRTPHNANKIDKTKLRRNKRNASDGQISEKFPSNQSEFDSNTTNTSEFASKNAEMRSPIESLEKLKSLVDKIVRELSKFKEEKFTLRMIRMTEKDDLNRMPEIMKDFRVSPERPIFFIAGGLKSDVGPPTTTTTTEVPISSSLMSSELLNDESKSKIESSSTPETSTFTSLIQPPPPPTILPVESDGESSVLSRLTTNDESSIDITGTHDSNLRRKKRSYLHIEDTDLLPIYFQVPGRMARTENPFEDDDDDSQFYEISEATDNSLPHPKVINQSQLTNMDNVEQNKTPDIISLKVSSNSTVIPVEVPSIVSIDALPSTAAERNLETLNINLNPINLSSPSTDSLKLTTTPTAGKLFSNPPLNAIMIENAHVEPIKSSTLLGNENKLVQLTTSATVNSVSAEPLPATLDHSVLNLPVSSLGSVTIMENTVPSKKLSISLTPTEAVNQNTTTTTSLLLNNTNNPIIINLLASGESESKLMPATQVKVIPSETETKLLSTDKVTNPVASIQIGASSAAVNIMATETNATLQPKQPNSPVVSNTHTKNDNVKITDSIVNPYTPAVATDKVSNSDPIETLQVEPIISRSAVPKFVPAVESIVTLHEPISNPVAPPEHPPVINQIVTLNTVPLSNHDPSLSLGNVPVAGQFESVNIENDFENKLMMPVQNPTVTVSAKTPEGGILLNENKDTSGLVSLTKSPPLETVVSASPPPHVSSIANLETAIGGEKVPSVILPVSVNTNSELGIDGKENSKISPNPNLLDDNSKITSSSQPSSSSTSGLGNKNPTLHEPLISGYPSEVQSQYESLQLESPSLGGQKEVSLISPASVLDINHGPTQVVSSTGDLLSLSVPIVENNVNPPSAFVAYDSELQAFPDASPMPLPALTPALQLPEITQFPSPPMTLLPSLKPPQRPHPEISLIEYIKESMESAVNPNIPVIIVGTTASPTTISPISNKHKQYLLNFFFPTLRREFLSNTS